MINETPRDGLPSIQIQIVNDGSCSNEPTLEQDLLRAGNLSVSKTSQGFYVQLSDSLHDLRPNEGVGFATLDDEFWNCSFREQREFFLVSLVLLLRDRGLYGLHSNAITLDDSGVLIVGDSGSGKTTLTLSMIREGWGYVSDDAIMLKDTGNGIEALALRTGFSCTQQTIKAFPELANAKELANVGKLILDTDAIYPTKRVNECRPNMIVFPQVGNSEQSELALMNDTETLIALIEQSAGISAGGHQSQGHLQVLNRLVAQTSAYRMFVGADVYENSKAVSDSLRRGLSKNQI